MTAETNKHIMERFTSEFLTTGDASLAEELLSADVALHFAGQQLRGRDRYLAVVAANGDTFDDLVWTVEDMVADGDTVAVRYTMTGTHRGEFAGSHPPARPSSRRAWPSTASPTARSSRSAPSSTCSESSSSSVPHQPRSSAPPPFAHQSPTPVRRRPRTETRGPHDHSHIRSDSTDHGAGHLDAERR